MADRTDPASLFGLAPRGVCRASRSPGCWWALTLRDLRPPTFSPLPCEGFPQGGMLSVALSRSLRTVGVAHHRVLWSPDFPLPGSRRAEARRFPGSDRPADLRMSLL